MIIRLCQFSRKGSSRYLSGYSGPPAKPKNTKNSNSPLVAPAYQMGHKKPETGILEVETGRVIDRDLHVKLLRFLLLTLNYMN